MKAKGPRGQRMVRKGYEHESVKKSAKSVNMQRQLEYWACVESLTRMLSYVRFAACTRVNPRHILFFHG
jgi:hypothetical protein